MMPLIHPEVVMNARTTDVSWDPTLVRVEYLDDAGAPYYCCFSARDQAPAPGNSPGPSGHAAPPRSEQAETQVGALLVVLIPVVIEKGVKGKGRSPPGGFGSSEVKPMNIPEVLIRIHPPTGLESG
jgi:hypothetical protein